MIKNIAPKRETCIWNTKQQLSAVPGIKQKTRSSVYRSRLKVWIVVLWLWLTEKSYSFPTVRMPVWLLDNSYRTVFRTILKQFNNSALDYKILYVI